MAVRLVVTITAAPGKGSELAQLYKARCIDIAKEPGCEQFEVFQSVVNPDKLTLLERWIDQAALDVHSKANATRPRVTETENWRLPGDHWTLNAVPRTRTSNGPAAMLQFVLARLTTSKSAVPCFNTTATFSVLAETTSTRESAATATVLPPGKPRIWVSRPPK